MKIGEYIEEIKNSLKNQYQIFENYDPVWLDQEVDDDLKGFIREKVHFDCFTLNGIVDEYAKYKQQDEQNLIEAYSQGINYMEFEENLPNDSSNKQSYDDYNVPYNDPVYFGEDIVGMGCPNN